MNPEPWYYISDEAYRALSLLVNAFIAIGTVGMTWAAFTNIRNQNRPNLTTSILANNEGSPEGCFFINIKNTGNINATMHEMHVSSAIIYPFTWRKVNDKELEIIEGVIFPKSVKPNDNLSMIATNSQLTLEYHELISNNKILRFAINYNIPLKFYIRIHMQNNISYTTKIDNRYRKSLTKLLKEYWKSGDQPKD